MPEAKLDRRRRDDPRLITVRAVVGRREFARIEAARGEESLSSFIRRHVLAACGAEPTETDH